MPALTSRHAKFKQVVSLESRRNAKQKLVSRYILTPSGVLAFYRQIVLTNTVVMRPLHIDKWHELENYEQNLTAVTSHDITNTL